MGTCLKLLSWMFEHDCLDNSCFGYLICICFVFLYLHLFSALSMFHMERQSRNTLNIIIMYDFLVRLAISKFLKYLLSTIFPSNILKTVIQVHKIASFESQRDQYLVPLLSLFTNMIFSTF